MIDCLIEADDAGAFCDGVMPRSERSM